MEESQLMQSLDELRRKLVMFLKESFQRYDELLMMHDRDLEESRRRIIIRWFLRWNRNALLLNLDVHPIFLNELIGIGVMNEWQKDEILSTNKRTDVNERFLDWLRRCSSGSYDQVLKKLEEDGQAHLVNLIEVKEGELPLPIKMRKKIYGTSGKLSEKMCAEYGLLDYMWSKGAISQRQWEAVRAKPTNFEKISELIEIVLRGSDRTFEILIEGLKETNQEHIASELQQELKEFLVVQNQEVVGLLKPRYSYEVRMDYDREPIIMKESECFADNFEPIEQSGKRHSVNYFDSDKEHQTIINEIVRLFEEKIRSLESKDTLIETILIHLLQRINQTSQTGKTVNGKRRHSVMLKSTARATDEAFLNILKKSRLDNCAQPFHCLNETNLTHFANLIQV